MYFYLLCLLVFGTNAGTNEEEAWSPSQKYGPYERPQCFSPSRFDRGTRDDISGPFWGNRGKRFPSYKQDILYAEEPQFVIVRGGHVEEMTVDENPDGPFFHARGRKSEHPPFFTSRGKRIKLT